MDFTKCERVEDYAYGGAGGNKIAVRHQDKIYMLKFPPSPKSGNVSMSYTNSCISEHIGCLVFRNVGINAQETMLGEYRTGTGKTRLVCACLDFTQNNKSLIDFISTKNSVVDSESNGTSTELEAVTYAIMKQKKVDAAKLLAFYYDIFVVDALLGNFDRHNGNFGLLYDKSKNSFEIAPIYDCGSCLLPQADDDALQFYLDNRGEFNSRIFNFPQSAIRVNGKKLNYYDYINSMQDDELNRALLRVVPKIDFNNIDQIINDTPYISDIRKDFYSKYMKQRFEYIIRPSFEKLNGRGG